MNATIAAAVVVSLVPLASFASTLEERVDALEKRQAELFHTPEEKRAEPGVKLSDRISISGLIEVNAACEGRDLRGGGDENESGLTLETAQLGVRGKINDLFTLNFVLLNDGENTVFDEATIDCERAAWFGRLGLQYAPFGEYPSHFIDDPLTLALGETQETAVLAGYKHGELLSVSAFAFRGDTGSYSGDDDLNDWGLSVKVTPLENLELGASLLSDLAESDADEWGELAAGGEHDGAVLGWSAFGRFTLEPVEVSAEVVAAAQRFDVDDLDVDGDGEGDKPLAWNLEIGYRPFDVLEIAARMEGSLELAGQPELQYGLDLSWGVYEGITLSASYLRGEFDADFGGGLKTRDRFVTQLGAEF